MRLTKSVFRRKMNFCLFSSTEYQLQSASPAVNFRTMGGVLDFYIVLGPTPEEVTKQYLDLIGKPFLPPYWSFGFQLSRWGYNSLDAMKAAIDRTLSCRFPLVCYLIVRNSPRTLTCGIKSCAQQVTRDRHK
jgi:alpha-glucosidase (family GH31 glycosyl hydrolase)